MLLCKYCCKILRHKLWLYHFCWSKACVSTAFHTDTNITTSALSLSAGLGKQRWSGEETSCYPWGRGEWWRAALSVKGPTFSPSPHPGPQLPPAIASPPPSPLPPSVRPHATRHPPDPCGQFQQRPSRTQPQVHITSSMSCSPLRALIRTLLIHNLSIQLPWQPVWIWIAACSSDWLFNFTLRNQGKSKAGI